MVIVDHVEVKSEAKEWWLLRVQTNGSLKTSQNRKILTAPSVPTLAVKCQYTPVVREFFRDSTSHFEALRPLSPLPDLIGVLWIGSRTVLEEFSHSQELFLLPECGISIRFQTVKFNRRVYPH
jgi:hypothetical protein